MDRLPHRRQSQTVLAGLDVPLFHNKPVCIVHTCYVSMLQNYFVSKHYHISKFVLLIYEACPILQKICESVGILSNLPLSEFLNDTSCNGYSYGYVWSYACRDDASCATLLTCITETANELDISMQCIAMQGHTESCS